MSADPVRLALAGILQGYAPLTSLLGTSTNIYHRRAPQQARPPVVIYEKRTGIPSQHFVGAAYTTETWAVRGFAFGRTTTRAEEIDAAIHSALEDVSMSMTGARLLAIWRETDILFTEQVGKEMFEHRGGMYRLILERD